MITNVLCFMVAKVVLCNVCLKPLNLFGVFLSYRALKKAVTTFSFLLFCFLIKGQDSARALKNRAYYIDDLTSKINVTLFMHASNYEMALNGKRSLIYQPNDYASVGLRFMHKWFGVAVAYAPQNIQEKAKGTTSYTNVQLSGYGKKIGFDIYYLDYSGFYLFNSNQFDTLGLKKGDFLKRSDLSTLTFGANLYYIFNHKKFSYRSSFVQNEIQKHSAGSFMMNVSANYYSFRADSSIVPRMLEFNLSAAAGLKYGDFYNLCVMPGYGHTFVAAQRLFLTLSIFGGLNIQQQHYLADFKGQRNEFDETVFIPRVMGRIGLGYNSNRFYCGIFTVGDTYNVPLGKAERMSYNIGSATLYLGYRFNVPKMLQNVSDGMDHVIPILFQKNN